MAVGMYSTDMHLDYVISAPQFLFLFLFPEVYPLYSCMHSSTHQLVKPTTRQRWRSPNYYVFPLAYFVLHIYVRLV
ncbi:hypothetical protein BZA77DRAFT_298780 [Pyronema omphalodes]|nr:hypothetical protein BZA77DRAFT_298780 [Pyronema omphalodes]